MLVTTKRGQNWKILKWCTWLYLNPRQLRLQPKCSASGHSATSTSHPLHFCYFIYTQNIPFPISKSNLIINWYCTVTNYENPPQHYATPWFPHKIFHKYYLEYSIFVLSDYHHQNQWTRKCYNHLNFSKYHFLFASSDS